MRRHNVQATGHNVRVAQRPCGTSSMIREESPDKFMKREGHDYLRSSFKLYFQIPCVSLCFSLSDHTFSHCQFQMFQLCKTDLMVALCLWNLLSRQAVSYDDRSDNNDRRKEQTLRLT